MGGAARNEKKRRQDAAARRLAAAGITVPPKKAPNRALVIVAAVVVVAVIAGLTIWYVRDKAATPVAATYTATQSAAVVTVGSGPVVVDAYEDYLCPVCERFEQTYGPELTTALNQKQITVRYHTIAILDQSTSPAGYSTRAANAALCSVAAGIYPAYHQALYDNQPAEGSAGLSNDELIKFGTDLNAIGDFASCVTSGKYAGAVTAETQQAASTPALQTNGQFGTPTIAIGGNKVDLNNQDWLAQAIAG